MRPYLLAAAVLLGLSAPHLAARAPAEAPLPPIVFQTQPPGQFLDNVRAAADVMFGEKGVRAVNKELKGLFGEKGLDGIDLGRPVAGYVFPAPKAEDFTSVIAFPVTGEQEFLTMCDRINRDKLKVDAKDKRLYHLPPLNPRYKALLRFSEGYAYIAYGTNPAPHFDAKSLVPIAKLYDPTDRAMFTGRLYFDRDPFGTKVAAWLAVPLLKEALDSTLRGFFFGAGEIGEWFVKGVEKRMFRFLLNGGAESFTVRVSLDPEAGSLTAEATLTTKAGSDLARDVAEYKPAPNRFASLTNHPDTAAAFHARAPLFAPEVRASIVAELEKGQKQIAAQAVKERAAMNEFVNGLIRTVKGKDLDVAVALRGPDKDGWFTLIGATVFDDPAKLEKEVKDFFKNSAPANVQDHMKWDADKVGKVGIHTFHFTPGGFLDFTKFLGGDDCHGAFAFAPDGIVGVVGPNPIPVLKDVLATKPAPAADLEVVGNPARIVKAFAKAAGPENRETIEMKNLLGEEDKRLPVLSIDVAGGKELRGTFTVNLRGVPRLMFARDIERANREAPVKPAPFEKK